MILQKHCIIYESPENNRSFTSVPVFTCNWKVVILTCTCKSGLEEAGGGGETNIPPPNPQATVKSVLVTWVPLDLFNKLNLKRRG